MPQPMTSPASHGRHMLIAATALLLLLLAVAGGAWWATREDTTIHYTTVPVARGAVTRTVTATGTVNPVLTIIVGSYVSGVIQQLFCDYNTQVKKGQVCAKIDPRPYQSMVDQDKANLEVAKAQLEKDKANLRLRQDQLERNRQARDDAISCRRSRRQCQERLRSGAGAGRARRGDHRVAPGRTGRRDRSISDYTDIVSPVDGTVVSRNVTMGQTVAASFQTPTLFLIATDLTKMEVDTNVSESDIGGVKEGDKATFTVDAFPSGFSRAP